MIYTTALQKRQEKQKRVATLAFSFGLNKALKQVILISLVSVASLFPKIYANSNLKVSSSDFYLNQAGDVSQILETPKYIWISEKLDFKPNTKKSGDSFASGAEIWSKNRWGISGSFSKNDTQLFGVPKNSEFRSLKLNRQLLRSKNKTDYLALGVGWQNIRIQDAIVDDGLTVSLSGKYSLAKSLQLYGSSAWFGDLKSRSQRSDIDGYKLEAGILFKTRSRFSFKAGYKVFDIDGGFNDTDQTSFQLGTQLNF